MPHFCVMLNLVTNLYFVEKTYTKVLWKIQSYIEDIHYLYEVIWHETSTIDMIAPKHRTIIYYLDNYKRGFVSAAKDDCIVDHL